MSQMQIEELEAFCSSCPAPNDVEAALQNFGLSLTFTMKAVIRRTAQVSIPAQYHFEGPDGTEILYLAGRDVGDGQIRLPRHRSRFWAIPGADPERYRQVTAALAIQWALHWQRSLTQEAA
jgi:hypothetical protein